VEWAGKLFALETKSFFKSDLARTAYAGPALERNQSNCVLTIFVEGRRSLLVAST